MGILLVITGPTGVGKTELTLRLAEHYGCPILNADSRQIFREIPIGTAAPTAEQMARVKHYFVGTRSINDPYNAGAYERDCMAVISDLMAQEPQRKVLAILSGGSMMYIDAVCKGLDDLPEVDSAFRERVRALYKNGGLEALQHEVQDLDPAYWNEVDQQNPQRLMHCIEISLSAGQPYSSLRTHATKKRPFDCVKIGLKRDRDELYTRINQRVMQMLADGLENEARQVWQEPVPNSLNTVGYKEMFAYFRGETDLKEATRLIQQNSRHYAKRQMTWLRQDKDIHWLEANNSYEEQIHFLDHLLP